MNSIKFTDRLSQLPTPFYYYNTALLGATLDTVASLALMYGYEVHYAMKANFNGRIVHMAKQRGLGADCVSGGEMTAALEAGIPAEKIVFAGVAKTDEEIAYGIEKGILCFNCESLQELQVIDGIAGRMGRRAAIALRINPDVDPRTHRYISTGKAENKFGIPSRELDRIIGTAGRLKNIEIKGLHFHIGSQIRDMEVFEALCHKVNRLQDWFAAQGLEFSLINVGGGLGVDYGDPESEPIADFARYFEVFHQNLRLRPGQTLHFELGRSIVAQCGELITRVLYTKTTAGGKEVVLVDAGMTDLIRPALYQAVHSIRNLTAQEGEQRVYTVAGPVCESSDVFAHSAELPETNRGDLLSILSAGAYGRAMASNYNLRDFPREVFSDDIR